MRRKRAAKEQESCRKWKEKSRVETEKGRNGWRDGEGGMQGCVARELGY